LKKETRKAVIANQDDLYALCIFRGKILEKIIFEENEKKLKESFENSPVKDEVKIFVDSGEEKDTCITIVKAIKRKVNKLVST